MRGFWLIGFVSVFSSVYAEPFTAEHLVRIDRVGAPVVSPDGTKEKGVKSGLTLIRAVLHASSGQLVYFPDTASPIVAGGQCIGRMR